MSKACKSYDLFFFGITGSGKRESNTLVTYLEVVNKPLKSGLIHDIVPSIIDGTKAPALREGPMSYQLVGEVKAHQGYDGYRA